MDGFCGIRCVCTCSFSKRTNEFNATPGRVHPSVRIEIRHYGECKQYSFSTFLISPPRNLKHRRSDVQSIPLVYCSKRLLCQEVDLILLHLAFLWSLWEDRQWNFARTSNSVRPWISDTKGLALWTLAVYFPPPPLIKCTRVAAEAFGSFLADLLSGRIGDSVIWRCR